MTSEVQKCQKCGKDFMIIDQEQKFYKRKGLPWPKECPECRQMERFSFRNERNLYERQCDKCQKPITSTFGPNAKYTVYCDDCYAESTR